MAATTKTSSSPKQLDVAMTESLQVPTTENQGGIAVTREPSASPRQLDNSNSKVMVGKGQSQGQQQVLGFYGARKQRTSLSIQTKLEVIKYAEENPTVTQNKIASHFGIDRTTVSKVLKRKAFFKFGDDSEVKSETGSPSEQNGNAGTDINDAVFETKEPHLNGYNGMAGVIRNVANNRRRSGSTNQAKFLRNKQSPSELFPKLEQQLTTQFVQNFNWPAKEQNGLYEKCESWFMKQRFTTASKKHEKDIIAYSCLISPLPLSIEDCAKIIPAKLVKDEAFQWLYGQKELNHVTLEGRGEELLVQYVQTEADALNEKLTKLFPGCLEYGLEEIRRIWRKYVHPKIRLFDDVEIQHEEMHEKQVYAPVTKLPTGRDISKHTQYLPIIPTPVPQPMLVLPASVPNGLVSASSHVLVPAQSNMTPSLPMTPSLSLATALAGSQLYSVESQIGLRESSVMNSNVSGGDTVLDLSTTENSNDGAVDLTKGSANTTPEKIGGNEKAGNCNIRGSRKRKSIPVRIAHPTDEELILVENGESASEAKRHRAVNTQKHPELMRCLDLSNNDVASNYGSNSHGSSGQHSVIEIIPDRYRDQQRANNKTNSDISPNYTNQPSQLSICSKTSSSSTMDCDNNNRNSDISNNNTPQDARSQTMLALLSTMSALSEQVKKIHQKVNQKTRSSESGSTADVTSSTTVTSSSTCACYCDCDSQLKKRISTMEEKIEAMQAAIEKLSSSVTQKE